MRVICAWCKKIIKHEDGTGGLDSHGICPACQDLYYPVAWDQGTGENDRFILQNLCHRRGER